MKKTDEIQKLKDLRSQGFYVSAIIFAKKILDEYPGEFSVLLILGNCLSAIDRHNEAIETIELALQNSTNENLYRGLVTMAYTIFQKGDFITAEDWYLKAFAEDDAPRLVDQVYYSECLINRGEYSKAVQVLTEAIDATEKPTDTSYYSLGVAYRAAENYTDALQNFKKAVALDPAYEVAQEAIHDILKSKVYQDRGN